MKSFIVKFLRDEEGVTIVEYAVAAGVMIAVTMTAFMGLAGDQGGGVRGMFDAIKDDLDTMAGQI